MQDSFEYAACATGLCMLVKAHHTFEFLDSASVNMMYQHWNPPKRSTYNTLSAPDSKAHRTLSPTFFSGTHKGQANAWTELRWAS